MMPPWQIKLVESQMIFDYDSYDFRRLLRRSFIALATGIAAVVICYVWVDRPVAYFIHDHEINQIRLFKWLTYPPPVTQAWSPLALALLMMRRARGPLNRWEFTLAAACVSLLVADQFRSSLGDVCGRYWPETWFDHNPSLIGNGSYGFHPFVAGDDLGSFPSGHATRILGFAAVWWLMMPRSRWICSAISLPMLLSLVAMNYHFVGDVIAGATVGGIVGAYAVACAKSIRTSDERAV
jgi:membrane-associated phospholipid phosphatase